MDDREEVTETSPLIAKSSVPDPVGTANGIPPSANKANGIRGEDQKPAEDEESQRSDEERAAQYQGMPEVKAKLKYILPAIGIGVCLSRFVSELIR